MTGKNFIGYRLSAEGNHSFRTTNPENGELSSIEFIEATSDEVDHAVRLASDSFPLFNRLEPHKRAAFLLAITQEIEELGEDLFTIFCFESGLSRQRAEIELNRTLFQLRSFAEALVLGDWMEASIDTANSESVPKKPDIRKMMTGIGPVVVFGASNFPLAYSTAGGDTASAFAAGCPVIVKSHPLHAGTGSLIAEAIVKAAKRTEMPEGVFSNLNSNDFAVGKQLVLHPMVKAVGFTGSLNGGRALFDLASARPEPIPVFAEMGSTNPVVVLESALKSDLNSIAQLLSESITNAAGQFCTKPGLLFIEKSDLATVFIDKLGELVTSSVPQSMLHSSIFEKFENSRKQVFELLGDKLFVAKTTDILNCGQQTLMVVDSAKFIEHQLLRNEVFGPFCLLVICNNVEDILQCFQFVEGSLTAGIFTGDEVSSPEKKCLIETMLHKAGRLIYNGVPTGVTVCPSMHHGGPYPSTTDSRFTAVGVDAMRRFLRPVVFQNFPDSALPLALADKNELGITRRINGVREYKSQ
jgi:2,5-dioxopentanoate dehydrogenase